MLRTLALCSALLFISPPPAASCASIEVRVLDQAGRPAQGMKVALACTPVDPKFRIAPAVSDRNGIARFSNALDLVRNDPARRYSASLVLPMMGEVRAELDFARVDEGPATLVVPPFGSIEIRLPAEARLDCSVRLFPTEASRPGAIPERQLGRALHSEIRNGRARFEKVCLGLEFEFEISGLGSSIPKVGRIAGPTRAGELVTFDVPAPPPELRLLARLVGEDGRPLANATVEWRLTAALEFPATNCEYSRGLVSTDAGGRIALPITGARRESTQPGNRALARAVVFVSPPSMHGRESEDAPSVRLVVPAFHAGQDCDLGEQTLARFGSPRKYEGLDDATLEQEFLHWIDGGFLRVGGDVHTEILCEMVRRGTPEFERFVAGVLQGLPEHPRGMCAVDELQLRTAHSRLEGRPDPIAIRLRGAQELELEGPNSTELVFEIENRTPGDAPLMLPATGLWPRPAIEVRTASGESIPQPLSKEWSKQSNGSPLAPGESRELRVASGRISLPGPGEYRVRIHCSPSEDLDRLETLAGRIYFSSDEITLRVREKPVH